MTLDKSLKISSIIILGLFLCFVLLDVTRRMVGEIESAYLLAERADLDYGKTVQDTAEYIRRSAEQITGLDYIYMDEPTSMELAIRAIDSAQRLAIDMRWAVTFTKFYLLVNKGGIYVWVLCMVILIIRYLRGAYLKEKVSQNKQQGVPGVTGSVAGNDRPGVAGETAGPAPRQI